MSRPLWGIDLGGTKVEGVIISSDKRPDVIARLRLPTEADKGYDHIVRQICKLVDLLKTESGLTPESIGIGTPGAMDPTTNTLKNSNTTCLNGKPLRQDIEKQLGIPVAMANDANCFAIAETLWGAVPEKVPDAKVVFGVILGTGVGGGLVMYGKVPNGRHGIAGEWGHNFLDASGGPCYCGHTGCVEQVLSGPALQKYYESLSGEKRKLPEIVERAKTGDDKAAVQTMDRMVEFFGKAISVIVNIVDPDAIVLGGGVGNIDLLYSKGVKEAEKHLFNPRLETPFLRPKLGDSAGVFGAALLTA
ncbi:ROK family protein [Imperialibacter roseus]|uniref:ROK family protein n=1 Tax=Imperialibacter roseus TaxID=1324217 RepID=A0ABZ0IMR2_9BACT|nr:ROK family protein [Imperialibacter roseus]WOK05046.1 ROK family protein [Imperialibacter roseus]